MYYGTTLCLFLQSSFDNSLSLSCGLVIWFSWFLVNMRLSMSCGYYWCWGRLRRTRLGILLQIGAASLTDGERNDKRPSYAFPVAHSAHCIAILFLDPLFRSSPILPFDARVHFTSHCRWIFISFFDCLHDLCTELDLRFSQRVLHIYHGFNIEEREVLLFLWRFPVKKSVKKLLWIQYWSNTQYINQNFLIVARLPLAYTCW
jgi:hypothetical protein